jgi:hypothetical protein
MSYEHEYTVYRGILPPALSFVKQVCYEMKLAKEIRASISYNIYQRRDRGT